MVGFDKLFIWSDDLVDAFLELLQPSMAHSSPIFLVYIAYHIWLTRNAIIFSSSTCPTRFIVEHARVQVEELQSLIVVTIKTWNFGFARRAPYQIFISWKAPSSIFRQGQL